MNKFALFTDGSVCPEARRAGWAYYAESGGRIIVRNGVVDDCKDVSVAELAAAARGLSAVWTATMHDEVRPEIIVYTDSLTVINWRSTRSKYMNSTNHKGPIGVYLESMFEMVQHAGMTVDFVQMTPDRKRASTEHNLVHCLARKAAKNLEVKSS